MKKRTINSILLNILWSITTLLPVIVILLLFLQGGKSGLDTFSKPNFNGFLWYYLGFERINDSSLLFTIIKSFLELFNAYSIPLCTLLLWIVYTQFIRIIFNLCFFIFSLSHKYLECFNNDTENDLL